jgi:hypothetical protein
MVNGTPAKVRRSDTLSAARATSPERAGGNWYGVPSSTATTTSAPGRSRRHGAESQKPPSAGSAWYHRPSDDRDGDARLDGVDNPGRW